MQETGKFIVDVEIRMNKNAKSQIKKLASDMKKQLNDAVSSGLTTSKKDVKNFTQPIKEGLKNAVKDVQPKITKSQAKQQGNAWGEGFKSGAGKHVKQAVGTKGASTGTTKSAGAKGGADFGAGWSKGLNKSTRKALTDLSNKINQEIKVLKSPATSSMGQITSSLKNVKALSREFINLAGSMKNVPSDLSRVISTADKLSTSMGNLSKTSPEAFTKKFRNMDKDLKKAYRGLDRISTKSKELKELTRQYGRGEIPFSDVSRQAGTLKSMIGSVAQNPQLENVEGRNLDAINEGMRAIDAVTDQRKKTAVSDLKQAQQLKRGRNLTDAVKKQVEKDFTEGHIPFTANQRALVDVLGQDRVDNLVSQDQHLGSKISTGPASQAQKMSAKQWGGDFLTNFRDGLNQKKVDWSAESLGRNIAHDISKVGEWAIATSVVYGFFKAIGAVTAIVLQANKALADLSDVVGRDLANSITGIKNDVLSDSGMPLGVGSQNVLAISGSLTREMAGAGMKQMIEMQSRLYESVPSLRQNPIGIANIQRAGAASGIARTSEQMQQLEDMMINMSAMDPMLPLDQVVQQLGQLKMAYNLNNEEMEKFASLMTQMNQLGLPPMWAMMFVQPSIGMLGSVHADPKLRGLVEDAGIETRVGPGEYRDPKDIMFEFLDNYTGSTDSPAENALAKQLFGVFYNSFAGLFRDPEFRKTFQQGLSEDASKKVQDQAPDIGEEVTKIKNNLAILASESGLGGLASAIAKVTEAAAKADEGVGKGVKTAIGGFTLAGLMGLLGKYLSSDKQGKGKMGEQAKYLGDKLAKGTGWLLKKAYKLEIAKIVIDVLPVDENIRGGKKTDKLAKKVLANESPEDIEAKINSLAAGITSAISHFFGLTSEKDVYERALELSGDEGATRAAKVEKTTKGKYTYKDGRIVRNTEAEEDADEVVKVDFTSIKSNLDTILADIDTVYFDAVETREALYDQLEDINKMESGTGKQKTQLRKDVMQKLDMITAKEAGSLGKFANIRDVSPETLTKRLVSMRKTIKTNEGMIQFLSEAQSGISYIQKFAEFRAAGTGSMNNKFKIARESIESVFKITGDELQHFIDTQALALDVLNNDLRRMQIETDKFYGKTLDPHLRIGQDTKAAEKNLRIQKEGFQKGIKTQEDVDEAEAQLNQAKLSGREDYWSNSMDNIDHRKTMEKDEITGLQNQAKEANALLAAWEASPDRIPLGEEFGEALEEWVKGINDSLENSLKGSSGNLMFDMPELIVNPTGVQNWQVATGSGLGRSGDYIDARNINVELNVNDPAAVEGTKTALDDTIGAGGAVSAVGGSRSYGAVIN